MLNGVETYSEYRRLFWAYFQGLQPLMKNPAIFQGNVPLLLLNNNRQIGENAECKLTFSF